MYVSFGSSTVKCKTTEEEYQLHTTLEVPYMAQLRVTEHCNSTQD
jgi:hypothetical protein